MSKTVVKERRKTPSGEQYECSLYYYSDRKKFVFSVTKLEFGCGLNDCRFLSTDIKWRHPQIAVKRYSPTLAKQAEELFPAAVEELICEFEGIDGPSNSEVVKSSVKGVD
jgi:hypothetical protein